MTFTKQLLGVVIKNGYKYFLCRTGSAGGKDPVIMMALKPVRMHPLLHLLPAPYQRYFTISQELLQMAEGLPGTRIVIELKGVRLRADNKVYASAEYLNIT